MVSQESGTGDARQRHTAAAKLALERERFELVHGNRDPYPEPPSYFQWGGALFRIFNGLTSQNNSSNNSNS